MPPRIPPLHSVRLTDFRSIHATTTKSSFLLPLTVRFTPRRFITAEEKPLPKADKQGPGPNQGQLPHVSEEASATGKITGEGGPELGQGTPVEEVLERDTKGRDKTPKVLQDHLNSPSPKGSRSYSTSARRQQDAVISIGEQNVESASHNFSLPDLPLPTGAHLHHRYDPVVHQVTQLLMRDGKLSVAQRNMTSILNHLRTTPPPIFNPDKPLMPDAPPASHLPLNPILYLTLAIDSVAPLLRIRSCKGAAGGGAALQVPEPIAVRQRRRTAVMWILDAASKKKFRGSGKGGFAQKVAEEIVAIVEGKSGVWERRGGIHKLGIAARSNLNKTRRR